MQFKNDRDIKAMMEELQGMEFIEDRSIIIGKLAELWEKYPHYRFGQLLKHVVSELHGNLYFIPDGVVLKNLQKFLDTGFAGVDRKEKTDDNLANKKLSVRWQLEQEKLAKEKEEKGE